MNFFLIGIGVIVALVATLNGLGGAPGSAPQQTVQRLDLVIAMLGLVVVGLGVIAGRISTAKAGGQLAANSGKVCPSCKAIVPVTAPMCGHCNHDFSAA